MISTRDARAISFKGLKLAAEPENIFFSMNFERNCDSLELTWYSKHQLGTLHLLLMAD